MKNRNIIFTTILLALACFGLLPGAYAVSPAPDGGYGPPAYGAGNTAEGQNALFNLSSGGYNTAVGFLSLESNTTAAFNTAIGAGALLANTGDQNTANGAGTLFRNTIGSQNTANGAFALFSNTFGNRNTANGSYALFHNTNANGNTASGAGALNNNTTGSGNTATGSDALSANTTGSSNTGDGAQALFFNTTGGANTAVGDQALASNTAASGNTAIGFQALNHNTTGSNNIALGAGAGSNITTASDTICIGIVGVDVTDGCYIGHVFEEAIDPDNLPMAIDLHGKVGTMASSRRFKDDIQPMNKASEAILALKPVTFHYKSDAKCSPRFGLIAEEVAKVDPNLVALDKAGTPYSVRYEQVNAMLLNEFLKEHKRVKEQHATIAELKSTVAEQRKGFQVTADKLQKEIRALTAQLKHQAEQIQKVSAQVELNKPALRMVRNNP